MRINNQPPNSLKYALGIDAGCASIGWAIVELDENDDPKRLYFAGARRFDAGVEGDIERGRDESLSQQRREARGPRRNTWRRQWRLRKVFRVLQQAALLPASDNDDHDSRHKLFLELDKQLVAQLDLIENRITAHVVPYTLRARSLDESLPPHALGRALYHLAQRRGFLSNLKTGRSENEEDRGKVKTGISELEQSMEKEGSRTLGEYLAGLDPEEIRIRQRWTARQMFRDEFDAIWKAQQPHHKQLTDQLREELEKAIFDQRPLKSQKGLIGRCDLEPFKRRASIACLPYQRFRLLQRINDLEVHCPDGEVRCLSTDERNALLNELTAEGDLTWAAIKTLLKMKKSRTYGRHFEFNFEQGGDKKMIGNRTSSRFASVLGETWHDFDETDQTDLVDDALAFEEEEGLVKHLQNRWKFSESQAQTVANLPLEAGYGNVSRKAARKLIGRLEEGIPYSTARLEMYPESFETVETEEYLPPFSLVAGTVRNPTITRTMSELRKIVNALISEHGKPALIRIELARDLKRSRKNRQTLTDQRDKNTKSREEAQKRLLEEMGPGYDKPHNILKLRLAEECNWTCPFTGRSIEMSTLVDSPQFDIEHIIPFSRSLDNSFLNKTLCYHDVNRHVKKNQTPHEAFSSTVEWDEILERVRHFQGSAARRKLQLFETEVLPNAADFAARQLSDTRYLSKAAVDYLATLYGGRVDAKGKLRVQASPGRLTALLRRAWELNRLVGDPDDSQQKDRADHRHHAIDAFLVAVSTPKIVQALNRAAAQAESLYTRDLLGDVDPPWADFSWKAIGTVIDKIQVSSRVNRKLNGRLHEATILSKPYTIPDPKSPGKTKTVHHVRKPLVNMSKGEVKAIVDPSIRQAVLDKLKAIGGDPKKAFADPNQHPYLKTKKGRLIPIHSARIRKSDKSIAVGKGSRLRRVCPGDNHHMEIIAVLDSKGKHKKWEGHIVSRFEAMRRWRAKEEIIRRDHGPGREFVFSLTGGEHVRVPDGDNEPKLLRVTGISGKEIECIELNDARPSTLRRKTSGARIRPSVTKLHKLGAKKVTIDPLGRVWPASD